MPKKKLQDRFSLFARGEWLQLLRLSQDAAECRGSRRIRQARADSVENRAERAQALAQLGELSSARQALEGFRTAPGSLPTLRALTNPDRRPARDPLPQSVVEHQATAAFALDPERFLRNVRCAIEKQSDSELLCNLGQELAEASAPARVVDVLRRGRITALQKPNGGVRGIVVGEVGAFDLVSRGAMLEGLRTTAGGSDALPFVKQFYGPPARTFGKMKKG